MQKLIELISDKDGQPSTRRVVTLASLFFLMILLGCYIAGLTIDIQVITVIAGLCGLGTGSTVFNNTGKHK
jgi:hypothetical protein